MAVDLARQVEYLAWVGRAETFDTYFLRQAEAMLRPKGLTALISGQARPEGNDSPAPEIEERATRFASWSRAIVTAVLLDLAEPLEISNPHQALIYLLSCDLRFAKAAALWTADHGMASVEQSRCASCRGMRWSCSRPAPTTPRSGSWPGTRSGRR